MPVNNTIISYTNLIEPFGSQGALLAKTQQAAAKVFHEPAKVQAAMMDLKTGLDMWQQAEIEPQVLHTPRHHMAALLQTHVVRQAANSDRVESFFLKIRDTVLEGFEVKFADQDWPEWAASFFTWISAIVPAVQPAPDPDAESIANNFHMGVLGDFGTGLYGAPVCQQSIQSSGEDYSLMLHLGDVYYSAEPEEVEQRFFQFWPDKAAMNRTMNGNHEMYTGGHTYFNTMLPRFNQKASYFAMQNDYWILIVLDTSYRQTFGGQVGVLDDAQMAWLSTVVQSAGPRKLVLFSHHQPFTQLDTNNGGNLIAQLDKYELSDKIYAWYWGHEHRCLIYDPHPKYGFRGRCAGHAAFPEARTDLTNAPASPEFGSKWRRLDEKTGLNQAGETVCIPGAWAYDTDNPYVAGFASRFAPNGFMRLEFTGDRLVEYVRAPDNSTVWVKEVN